MTSGSSSSFKALVRRLSLCSTKDRILCAIALGVLAAAGTYASHQTALEFPSDWDEIWAAGRVLLSGQDPYDAMQKAYAAGQFKYPLIYPGPAVVVSLPFALLPLPLALAVWSGLGAGMLSWVLTGRGWWGLLGLCSVPFFFAYMLVQWSPLLTAAIAFPWLGFLWIAKPTIGLPLFAAWPSRQAVIWGAVLMIISLVVMPHWPWSMKESIRTAINVKPIISRPGGFILLLALLRWRRPEGRLLAMLSVVPQTTFFYEMVPLVLIPQTWRQMVSWALLSLLAFLLPAHFSPLQPRIGFAAVLNHLWPFWLMLIYLPALLMVLSRPNEKGSGTTTVATPSGHIRTPMSLAQVLKKNMLP
jgi:hypothetical protein